MGNTDELERAAIQICKNAHYTFVGAVGTGAFKATFHVKDVDGSSKALKVYNSNNKNARVEREVDAMSRCDHPSIAKFELLETTTIDAQSVIYSLEEFISGGTLEDLLAQGGELSQAQTLTIGLSLIEAVGHLAGHDLVHRDIKPANIMVRSDQELSPVLVDFGLVRSLGESSLTATWIPHGPGTPIFSPPEQLNNDKDLIDWRADQFALGVVLTMCMTSRHPYHGEGQEPIHVVERVAARADPPEWFIEWTKRNSLAPLLKMVKPWPVQRYRTPEELSAAWKELA